MLAAATPPIQVKPEIIVTTVDGKKMFEVVCAGMTKRTVNEWQAKIYLQMAEEAYSADANGLSNPD